MRSVITSSVTLLIASVFIFYYPEHLLNPGKISLSHDFIHEDCLKCHTVFTSSVNLNCISCHPVNEIDYKRTNGSNIENKSNIKIHGSLKENDCTECHTEHYLINGKITKTFSHELLDDALKNKCTSCHITKPVDYLHQTVKAECVQCHNSENWKTASFKHTALNSDIASNCVICHSKKKPTDELHINSENECGSCHTTEEWKPADFNHDKFFVFDKHHPNECNTCHISNYKTYTCYGCHEHSPSKIREEHQEEGIYNYEDCISCHRSGNKHDTEHNSEHNSERNGTENKNNKNNYKNDENINKAVEHEGTRNKDKPREKNNKYEEHDNKGHDDKGHDNKEHDEEDDD